MTNFPIQSTAQIMWNVVVNVEQVQDTKRKKTKRWHRASDCHRPFLPNRNLKNRHLGNWRFTVYNCVTEVKWWNRRKGLRRVSLSLSVLLKSLQLLLHSFTVTVLVNVTTKSQKLPSSLESMQQNHNLPKHASSKI